MNTLDEQRPFDRRTSRSISILERQATEDRSLAEESKIKEEEFEESDEGTVVPKHEERDSIARDVISDDEDTKMI